MRIHTFIIILFILFTGKIFSQESFEGYILCIDNEQIAEEVYNEYYFLPLDFNKNNISFNKETLEHKDDKLELKVRNSGGSKVYKFPYLFKSNDCIENPQKDIYYYVDLNLDLVFFHYKRKGYTINNDFFLKKIKKNNFFVCKIKFQGCELIDRDNLKSEILKIFVYSIQEISVVGDEEKESIIQFIKCRR
ncbi:hypothetical protein DI487_10255 [Flavobacterium sediminis]|uniref:Uncharacterized protein n=1 Tax=Flavobacterium sediminis TaxID=2201181 RepID=A0A2U8QWB9_9FLAO|nr:hypothetical protein [Flavobacterium sediminis]AWM14194.1 hypothetical protein DI487_10255 [Flavobacterium sediminis]